MSDISTMVQQVRDFFDEKGYNYSMRDDECIETGFNIDSKIASVDMFFFFDETGYKVYSKIGLKAAERYRDETLRYINMVNWAIKDGNFEMDMRDGEVVFRMFVRYSGLDELSEDIIDASCGIPIVTIARFGDGLAAVMMGFSDAETAFAQAREDEDDDD